MALGWNDEELRSLTLLYLKMLEAEHKGERFVKADFNRSVQDLTGRSKSAVEFKFANLSAVLDDLGLDWVQGYLPRFNYQAAMTPIAEEMIASHYPVLLEVPRRTEGVRGVPQADPAASRVQSAPAEFEPLLRRREVVTTFVPVEDSAVLDPNPDPSGAGLQFHDLWERASGGLQAAVDPDTEEQGDWPRGKSAPGGDELFDVLVPSLRDREPGGTSDLVFLVGGPGNGKSELLKRAVKDLVPVADSAPGISARAYEYVNPHGHRLLVVNDASIPPAGAKKADGALLADIEEVLDGQGSGYFAINRGRLDDGAFERANNAVAGQLLSKVRERVAKLSSGSSVKTLARWETSDSGRLIRVWVVLMDACSLFEARPANSVPEDLGIPSAGEYKIKNFPDRPALGEDTPAGEVLAAFVSLVSEWALKLPLWHPVRANVESLQNGQVRATLVTWLRGAELAAGRKMTYRDVWGALVRAVVADIPERMSREQADTYFGAFRDQPGYQELAELADLRMHQSVVSTRRASASNVTTRHPVLRMTSQVDPARDATPNWSRPVHRAMAFRSPEVGPLAALEERDGPLAAVTPFDRMLDDAFVDFTAGAKANVQRRESGWYGSYLLRLYALSRGIVGFERELASWTAEWTSQVGWKPAMVKALRTMFFPTGAGRAMQLPVLESRAVPIVGPPDTPRFVRQVDPTVVSLRKRRNGDQLYVVIEAPGDPEIELDFALLREALACADGHQGVSDRAGATVPRLERIRANLLHHDSAHPFGVLDRDHIDDLEVN